MRVKIADNTRMIEDLEMSPEHAGIIISGKLKLLFIEETGSKSFGEWVEELNQSGNYEGEFCIDDAIDALSSMFILNIDEKHVNIYKYFMENAPESLKN